jgi:hypothetical protein
MKNLVAFVILLMCCIIVNAQYHYTLKDTLVVKTIMNTETYEKAGFKTLSPTIIKQIKLKCYPSIEAGAYFDTLQYVKLVSYHGDGYWKVASSTQTYINSIWLYKRDVNFAFLDSIEKYDEKSKDKLKRIKDSLDFYKECDYSQNEYDDFKKVTRKTLYPYLVCSDLNVELWKVGENKYADFYVPGVGCSSPYNTYISLKLSNGQILKLKHCGEINCNEAPLFRINITQYISLLKKYKIVKIRVEGTQYYRDYEVSGRSQEYIKVKLHCLD